MADEITRGMLRDPRYYQLHREEVLAAARAGRIKPSTRKPTSDVTFSRSQLRDPKFYRENQAAIELAMKENRIVDDIARPRTMKSWKALRRTTPRSEEMAPPPPAEPTVDWPAVESELQQGLADLERLGR
jgi:hypothetical protein